MLAGLAPHLLEVDDPRHLRHPCLDRRQLAGLDILDKLGRLDEVAGVSGGTPEKHWEKRQEQKGRRYAYRAPGHGVSSLALAFGLAST